MNSESRIAELFSTFQIRYGRSFASMRAFNTSMRNSIARRFSSRRTDLETSAAQPVPPATSQERAETFFDAEFLKKIERLRLVAKRLSWAGAKGEHAVSRKGFSLEFSDYRNYQPGDDLRYVDWNIYRRLERLLVKVFTGRLRCGSAE